MKKVLIILLIGAFLTGCTKEDVPDDQEQETVTIVQGEKGDYSIIVPFESSALRQDYGVDFREIDMMEIGSQLLEMTKNDFSPNSYYIGEGTIINRDRYYTLLGYENEDNPNGLNIQKDEGFTMSDGVVLKQPQFVSDIVEINYYNKSDYTKLEGIAFALVLKRVQQNGLETYRLSDDDLFTIGSTIGLRFQSYLRGIDGLVDKPIFIGLYVQESDMDVLPGRYLPGYFIGHSFSTSITGEFSRDDSKWYFMNSDTMNSHFPQLTSKYTLFKNNVSSFYKDENISVVGKAFVNGDSVNNIQIQVTTGSKTYVELYALTQYINSQLVDLEDYDVVVNIRINQTTRFVITKNKGQDAVITKVV